MDWDDDTAECDESAFEEACGAGVEGPSKFRSGACALDVPLTVTVELGFSGPASGAMFRQRY